MDQDAKKFNHSVNLTEKYGNTISISEWTVKYTRIHAEFKEKRDFSSPRKRLAHLHVWKDADNFDRDPK